MSTVVSLYEEMFGKDSPGRPPIELSTGRETGDRKLTEKARRRAARILRHKHQAEFEALMLAEIRFLEREGSNVV